MAASLTTGVETEAGADLWADVIGQAGPVDQLRSAVANPSHAYLFVGPAGVAKRLAAQIFAGQLLSIDVDPGSDAARRTARLVREGHHPDLTEVVRTGATVVAAQAEEVVRLAALSPVEGRHKVLLLADFHLVEPAAAPKLLKTIEEPPPGTHFIILAEDIPPDLVTIASRCVRIDFGAIGVEAIVAALTASGVEADAARDAAEASRGNLDRARLLATDSQIANRRQAWRRVPTELDGTGSAAARLADELLALIEDAQLPLTERHATELEALAAREEETGTRGSGRKGVETRHKREARRHRTEELRFGLAELAAVYRQQLASGAEPQSAMRALDALIAAERALIRNPNETLLLQALLLRLG